MAKWRSQYIPKWPSFIVGLYWLGSEVFKDELVGLVRAHIPQGGPIMFMSTHPSVIAPGLLIVIGVYAFIQSKRMTSCIYVENPTVSTRPLLDGSGRQIGTPIFAEAYIGSKSADAKSVRASITVYRDNAHRKLFSMPARWANTSEQRNGAKEEEQEIIPIKESFPEPLLVALKYTADKDAYGLNRHNETASIDWRDPAKRIPPGQYRIAIVVRGSNVKQQEFTLTLINKGKGYPLEWGT